MRPFDPADAPHGPSMLRTRAPGPDLAALAWGWPGSGVAVASAAAVLGLVAAVLAVYAPVLGHYFYGDDFVPLADIASRGGWEYLRDLVLMRDLTPNWRVLPGVFYFAAYRTFGLNAAPFMLANVAVHLATVVLLFTLVRRATGELGPALVAALFFGLSPAHVPTVGQVTAFNNVLAVFFVVAALLLLYEGLSRERLLWWLPASALAFAAAIASNESTAVLAPVFAFVAVWKLARWGSGQRPAVDLRRLAAVSAPYVVLGAAALATFGACQCTEADGVWGLGKHVNGNLWIFLGRLVYPVGLEPPGAVGAAHQVAGLAAAGLALLALVRGLALARIAAVFLVLALLPYLPIESWTAARYVYLAAVPFSILAGLYFGELARYSGRLTPVLPAAVALLALGVIGVYGWQTWDQNRLLEGESARWETLATELQEIYPDLPPGSTVYARNAPVSDALAQCVVMPALGEVLWGDAKLFTAHAVDDTALWRIRPGYHVYAAEFAGGFFHPVAVAEASPADLRDPSVTLLPHVEPEATGNLCRLPASESGQRGRAP